MLASQGASITVNDHSFEANVGGPGVDGDLAAGGWSNDLSPEWQERDGANDPDSFEEFITGFSADGNDHVGMNPGVYLWQDTGVALQPNTQYTLTIAAGNRDGQSVAGNVSTYGILAGATNLGVASYADTAAVVADAGLTLASSSVDATVLAAAGTFVDAPALVFTTGAVVPNENVVILLGSGNGAGGGRSHFDNIRLDATAVIPEVSTSLFGALAGLILLRRRR